MQTLSTSSAAQLISDPGWVPASGYGYEGVSNGITGWRATDAVSVGQGATLEGLARQRYGDDWRAGMALMTQANGIESNRWGSPLTHAGDNLRTPSLGGLSEGDYASYSTAGGKIIANNTAGLTEKVQMEAAAQQRAVQAAANGRAGVADIWDARDVRLSFGYQSMMSRQSADAQALAELDAQILRGPQLSASSQGVDFERVRANLGMAIAGPTVAAAS